MSIDRTDEQAVYGIVCQDGNWLTTADGIIFATALRVQAVAQLRRFPGSVRVAQFGPDGEPMEPGAASTREYKGGVL